jgi:hypothetical protein
VVGSADCACARHPATLRKFGVKSKIQSPLPQRPWYFKALIIGW